MGVIAGGFFLHLTRTRPIVIPSWALLELMHSNLYEINIVLTKGGNKQMMNFIDDAT